MGNHRRNKNSRQRIRRPRIPIPRRSQPVVASTLAPDSMVERHPYRRSVTRPNVSRQTRGQALRRRTSRLPGHLPKRRPDPSARPRHLSRPFSSGPLRRLRYLSASGNVVAGRYRKVASHVSATRAEPQSRSEHRNHSPQSRAPPPASRTSDLLRHRIVPAKRNSRNVITARSCTNQKATHTTSPTSVASSPKKASTYFFAPPRS